MKTSPTRALVGAGATAALLLAGSGLASAHVTVVAPGAEQGGYTVLTFRVPTESDTAGTTAVSVGLPDLKSARTEPMPGWTATIEKDPETQLAAGVTWTADPGVAVDPGRVPAVRALRRAAPRARRRCSSPPYRPTATATSSRGISSRPATAEPERPAPSLTLAASNGDGHGGEHHHRYRRRRPRRTNPAPTSPHGGSAASVSCSVRWALALGLGAVIRGRRS